MNADARVMKYFPTPLSPQESASFFDRIGNEFATEGFGLYVLEQSIDSKFLGFTGLHRISFAGELHGAIEIGWRLCADAWGNGYATEAAKAALIHAATLGIPEVFSFTTLSNLPSQRVMQRLGMEYIGEFDHPALPAGHPLLRHILYRIHTGR